MKTESEKPTQESGSDKFVEKASQFTDEKGTQVGKALENANEKIAGFKEKAEVGYEKTLSPAIDRAQVDFAGAGRYLQDNSARDYLRDLEGFARQHPRMTAAISALIGWKLGRALKFTK